MKIGILNFHRALNYGAVLQCYGLQETLKNLGYRDVEVIDYRTEKLQKSRLFFSRSLWKDKQYLTFFKFLFKRIFSPTFFSRLKASVVFSSFLSKKIQLSCVVTVENFRVLDNYDFIIVGSDQVWSESLTGLDPILLGDFPHKRVKFVAYAASLGSSLSLNTPTQQRLINYLSNYSEISVRESYIKEWLSTFNIKATEVLDPSLLANEKVFEELAIKPKFQNYVLLLQVSNCAGADSFARNIAQQLGCKVVTLKSVRPFSYSKYNKTAVSPMEYCGLVKYAKCVITVSFHATAFSIVFRKDFYVMRCSSDERSMNILTKLNIKNRAVSPNSKLKFSPIDYKLVNDNLLKLRDLSTNFLIKSLH